MLFMLTKALTLVLTFTLVNDGVDIDEDGVDADITIVGKYLR